MNKPLVQHPQIDLDASREYFCVVDEVRHDGKKCPTCGRISNTPATDMRVEDVVVPITHRVYYRKGQRAAVMSMIAPRQHLYGWNENLGDYRVMAKGVKDGPETT